MEESTAIAMEMVDAKSPGKDSYKQVEETELNEGSEEHDSKNDLAAAPAENDPISKMVSGASGASGETEENVLSDKEKDLFEAVVNGDLSTIKKLTEEEGISLSLKNKQGNPLIHYAVKSGRSDTVAFLLEHQVDVNSTNTNGTSPLHLAAFSGFNEIIEMLYYAGVNVNHQDSSGNSALHFSCQFNHPDSSMVLINCGSQLDLVNSIGDTPLHGACRHNMLSVVGKMCELGCPLNTPNGHGETPLHLAAKSGSCEIVRTLLLHGANLNMTDRDRKIPENLATDPEVLKLFTLYNQVMQSASQNKKFEMRRQLASSGKPLSRLKLAVLGNTGVGKTTFIESLKCGFIKSFFWSSYYTISKATKTPKDPTTSNVVTRSPNTNYTKGVVIENTNISDLGDVAIYEYSGLESYYGQYSLFLGDSSTIHLIVTSMSNLYETRFKQIDFWLEFIRIRMSPKEPIGFAGCNMWAPNVFIIATNPNDSNCSKNNKGEWVLRDEDSFLGPLLEKYERDIIISRQVFVMDAQLPSSPEMKELKKTLLKLKTYIQNFLPSQLGCLDQTLLELPSLRTSLSLFPVVSFLEFAALVRDKVNLLASDDNIQEILIQLQLMGEIICFGTTPDEVIILNPAWLGREVIGKLFSHEAIFAHTTQTGFLSESFLKDIFQKFDFSRIINLLKALSICYDRTSSNHEREYYIHAYNKADFRSSGTDWLEDRKSASLRSAICLETTMSVKDQLIYILPHVISALHVVFIGEKCELSQWQNACRVFEDGKTAIITFDNDEGCITVMCHSTHDDASKLFTFSETICAVIYSSADQQCPGLFIQRLPAFWYDCKDAALSPSYYEAQQILADQLVSPKLTIQLDKNSEPESLVDVLAFGSEEAYKKFVISTEAHVSCLSYYAKCQLACVLDKEIDACKSLAEFLKVDEQIVPIEPGSLSIFGRLMTYWSTDATVTIRRLYEALKSCGATEAMDMLLQLTPIYVYLPSTEVLE